MPYPSKKTPELIEAVLRAISEGPKPRSLTAACGDAGISRKTWSMWEAEDPDLIERRTIARAKGQSILEGRILDPEVTGPEANVLRQYLGAIDVEHWGERRVDIQGGTTLTDLAKADVRVP